MLMFILGILFGLIVIAGFFTADEITKSEYNKDKNE